MMSAIEEAEEIAEEIERVDEYIEDLYDYDSLVKDYNHDVRVEMDKEDLLEGNESLEDTILWLMDMVLLDDPEIKQDVKVKILRVLDEIKGFLGDDHKIVQLYYKKWEFDPYMLGYVLLYGG